MKTGNDFKFFEEDKKISFEDKMIDYKNMTNEEQKELYLRMKREKYFEKHSKEEIDPEIGGVVLVFVVGFIVVVILSAIMNS